MLRIFKKSAASSGSTAGDDFSTWELVNAAISDDEDGVWSFDGDEEEAAAAESKGDPKAEEDEEAGASRDLVNPKVVVYSMTCLSVSPGTTWTMSRGREGDGDGDEEDEDWEWDEEEMDDELVPWKVKQMVGKQRIRKMGKKGGPKVTKSKKLPYYPNRPGCLYGKHGFGVQHSFV